MHIKVEELKKGMRFSKDVFFDDGHCLLLSAGNTLSDREMRALTQWKIPFVVTDGNILKDEEDIELETLETLDDDLGEVEDITNKIYIEGSQLSNENIEIVSKMVIFDLPKELRESQVYTEYQNLLKDMREVFSSIKEGKPLATDALFNQVSTIKKMATEKQEESIIFVLCANTENDEISLDTVNGALLCGILCAHMNVDPKTLTDIIVASLIYRVGFLRLPHPVPNKKEALTDAEIQVLNTHISFAHKCAVQELKYTESVGKIILQRYERYDGKGYPKGLIAENIELGSRIIAVVDEFITMLHHKGQKKPITSYEAIKNLLADSSHKLDPNVVKTVLQCVGLYPIGSIVLLNDGSLCKVIKTANDAPLRPTVQVVLSNKGKIPTEKDIVTIDLKTNKEKLIVKAVDPRVYLQ